MRALRLLRIFIPLLIGAAIVAGIIVVLSSRSELKKSHNAVADTWIPLRDALDERYNKLSAAEEAVKLTPGPVSQISAQVRSAYGNWRNLEPDGSVGEQVKVANNLESLGRRLVVASRAAPRLVGKTTELGKVNEFAALKPPPAAADFDTAVGHFEDERNRPARSIAARILGYDSIPTYYSTAPF